MKNLTLILVVTAVAGCSTNENDIVNLPERGNQRNDRMTQYIHLAAGDSLGYNLRDGGVEFYTVVGPEVEFQGERYHTLRGYSVPFSGDCPAGTYLIRADGKGDVYLSDSLGVYLLYRTNASVGSRWYFGELECTLESRTDTVNTACRTFTGCLRVNIGSNCCARELDWLAPEVGLVAMYQSHLDYHPYCLTQASLADLKLKTAPRR